MKKVNLIILLHLCSVQISLTQVMCSKHVPKVIFGPKNVIVENYDPSEFYINEIDLVIDSLVEKRTMLNAAHPGISHLEKDISALESIRDDWIQWSKLSNHENASNAKTEVKEYFERVEIQNPDAMQVRGTHIDRNCLRSNPNDCLFYGRIKKWEILIQDDFGNAFIPDYHSFKNVGFETTSNDEFIFYRVRRLEE